MSWLDRLRSSPEDRFARLVIRELEARGWDGSIAFDRATFSVKPSGDDGPTHFLDNLYAEHRRAPNAAAKADLFDSLHACLAQSPLIMTWEVAAPLLLPALRNRFDLLNWWLDPNFGQQKGEWDDALRSLAGPIAVVAAIDRPETIELLKLSGLRDLGVSFDTAIERGLVNLALLPPARFRADGDGLWISGDGDLHDAARILLPTYADELAVEGERIVVPLARNGAIVADSAKADAVAALVDLVNAEAAHNSRLIARTPLVRRAGVWVPYYSTGHDMRSLMTLHLLQTLDDYGGQRALLQAYCERTARDLYVAELIAMEVGQGSYITYATWSDVPILLPSANYIALANTDGPTLFRRWDEVMSIASAQMTLESWDPPRWFVAREIPCELFERLRRDFTDPAFVT